MISLACIEKGWINSVSAKNRNADTVLTEKVIRALMLLEGLAESNISFVFKGGTALMLMLNVPKRFSIDIDVWSDDEQAKIEAQFDHIVQKKAFNHFEKQSRKNDQELAKAHYKFFYTPSYKKAQSEDYVLLDVVFGHSLYQAHIQLPIQSTFIKHEGAVTKVKAPDYNNLLGDKLTAFAPRTIGIPYYKNNNSMGLEIVKQLYDIASVFDQFSNMVVATASFKKHMEYQLKKRKLANDTGAVLDDIYQTAYTICTKGQAGNADYGVLLQGIKSIGPYVFSENYHLERAITDASKVAYLSSIIKHNKEDVEKFNSPVQIKDWVILQPFNTKLNKLKKTNPEAFFFWYKTFCLETM
jgi:predicted nucleotidyltransferase component of viral defense system